MPVKRPLAIAVAVAVYAGPFCAGCGGPNKANIELRKQNQALRKQVKELERAREADAATIRSLQGTDRAVTTLPLERLESLYTTHGLRIGKLTGGFDTDRDKPGDELLKVYAVPLDRTGDLLKAAGSFTVELFDLSDEKEVRIGQWAFSAEQTPELWHGQVLSYGYVLPCPWQTVPEHENLTVKVAFTDALTGRTFTEQKQIDVKPPETAVAQSAP